MPAALLQQIRALIQQHGRITFAQFMQLCLYSPRGGFYASRRQRIGAHFGTSPTSHPVFGALIARQLEQMWRCLGAPSVFPVIEVGAGDGALAQSIAGACRRMAPDFAGALYYVAADYEPFWPRAEAHRVSVEPPADTTDAVAGIQRVKAAGLAAFRDIAGCIVSNELIDNFPVHRFVIQDGRVKEVFVTLAGGHFTEVLDEPSTTRIEARISGLGLTLADGYRGEVNLALADWTRQVCASLTRGYVLTIDYGANASELYAPENNPGTLVCYHQHAAHGDPYQNIGQQDITCHVDFTTLMHLGEQQGLATVGYIPQRQFLTNLGFDSYLDALDSEGQSAARTALNRMAMMALVDPLDYGDLKVLAQAKGAGLEAKLMGFA